MSLVDRLSGDLTAAMMAKAALKNKEIDKKAPLDDSEATKILQGLVKQREDSVEQFRKGNRPDLVAKEQAEIVVLRGYLPEEASEAEIRAAVEKAIAETGAASPKDLGRVMSTALAALRAAGKPVDGKKVNEAARAKLGSQGVP
jgi:uncharacterized protein YqeY